MLEKNEKVADLAKDAKDLESDGAKFMDPGAKRRGRPKGSTKPKTATSSAESTTQASPEPQGPPTVDIVRPAIKIIGAWVPRLVKDDRAKMMPEEEEQIAICTAALVDKYAMSLGKYAVELGFLFVCGAYSMRVIAINEDNKEKRAKSEREPFERGPADVPRQDSKPATTGNGAAGAHHFAGSEPTRTEPFLI